MAACLARASRVRSNAARFWWRAQRWCADDDVQRYVADVAMPEALTQFLLACSTVKAGSTHALDVNSIVDRLIQGAFPIHPLHPQVLSALIREGAIRLQDGRMQPASRPLMHAATAVRHPGTPGGKLAKAYARFSAERPEQFPFPAAEGDKSAAPAAGGDKKKQKKQP
jgi:hypothetical protein